MKDLDNNKYSLNVLQSFVESKDFSNASGDNSQAMFNDIDFSEIKGKSVKTSLYKAKDKLRRKNIILGKNAKRKPLPLTKKFEVKPNTTKNINSKGNKDKTIRNVLVSKDQTLIINGVSDFILNKANDGVRNIGYYKGEKLSKLLLTFNNTNGNDLTIDIFNPNGIFKYFIANSQDLDDRIVVGDGGITYSEVLYNLLANPTIITGAKFQFQCNTQLQLTRQINEPLFFTNKDIRSYTAVKPSTITIDAYQYLSNVVDFDILEEQNRPFFPNGTDTIRYNIYAGTTASMCFYYKQHVLIEEFFKLAKEKRKELNNAIL